MSCTFEPKGIVAEAGKDYEKLVKATLQFESDNITNCFDIPIIDDDSLEDTEIFALTFTQEHSICHNNQSTQMMTIRIFEDPTDSKLITLTNSQAVLA